MEVTVLETGDLPPSTIMSFHTGTTRRHAQMEKNKAISLSHVGSEPVRVDLMSQIGSHTFDMVPGQDVYDVPISSGEAGEVKLKFQIREATRPMIEVDTSKKHDQGDEIEGNVPGSPSRKLQTALMMRSYLDHHDVLRQMQELLQEMVMHRPQDPIEYMIQRLEQVCRETQGVEVLDHDAPGEPEPAPPPAYDAAGKDEGEAKAAAPDKGDDASDEDDDTGYVPPAPPITMAHRPTGGARRREGVSAEAMKEDSNSWTPPVYAKSPEERQQLSNIIRTSHDSKLHMLFGVVPKETYEKIVDAMQLRVLATGENVIKQGDEGDYFYIVKSGQFDIFVQKLEDPPKKVFQAGVGFAFGELALLYNAPRSATITASEASEVWSLDRTAFRNLVVRSAEARFNQHVDFLSAVDVFQVLTDREKASLAEVLEEEEFEDDEAIVEQGERDDKMFILLRGKAVACIKGEQGEVEVMSYKVGQYFGEIALLSGEPRKASVYALGACACLYITRQTFLRVLGSLSSLLERNISKYEKYQDAIAHAVTEHHEDGHEPEDDEHPDGEGGAEVHTRQKSKVVNRKRDRHELGNIVAKKVNIEDGEEPSTLADKVAQDFQNTALVTPAEQLIVPGTQFVMFGGLVAGQKFTMDKALHVHFAAAPEKKDGEEHFSWSCPSKLKHDTEIGVVCQKGQKNADDPTPNQDNYFVHHKDGVSMYGVCDGHGPFGHLVSFRLVQTLPYFITNSEHFGKDWPQALKEAFMRAQQDLCDFCAQHDINIQASGAAGSVLVLEEQTVHIAYIGDAKVMLGSWNRRDSRMIFCTTDHKPQLPEEKARLEASGSEVREIDKNTYRIYLPGSNFPGLTMSRAFGDVACGGVLTEPAYHKFLMQPTDQWYAIVASDGIWEFMDGEEVCNLTAKKLRMKGPSETINFMVNASRKRWAACCGDYCDDITAVLVQWNTGENQGGKHNHSLTVKRPAL